MVHECQQRIISATEVVPYSQIIRQSYPPYAIMNEPFIGVKILCKDINANRFQSPRDRWAQIESNLGFMRERGCLIRETRYSLMPDGFWVITLPVPKSQFKQQLSNLMSVLETFHRYFGIMFQNYVEINVSGHCRPDQTERCLSCLDIPSHYMMYIEQPENSAYRYGHITRINNEYAVFRTRWKFQNPQTIFEDISVLSQIISSMF